MSLQAEYCVQLLMMFYAELDQRTGWGDRAQIIKVQKEKGIAEGRTESALDALVGLQMLDQKTQGGRLELKLSSYGLDWFEKHFQLVERGQDSYRYEWSPFRKIRLVPPDVFYGRKSGATLSAGTVNWTKWGTILAGVGILVTIALWKLS